MDNNKILEIIIKARDQASEVLKKVQDNISNHTQSLKENLGKVKDAFGAVGIAASTYLAGAIQSAAKGEESTARLKTIVENQGQSWDKASKQVSNFTTGIMKMSTYSGGQAKEALTVLEQKGVKLSDALKMQATMTDLAVGKNIDLTESANILADAYNGKTRGLLALGLATKDEIKDGISFNEVQKRINERFGGSASAQLNTYNGQAKQFSNTLASFKTSIGTFLLPYAEKVITVLNNAAQTLNSLDPQTKKIIATILSLTAVLGTLIGGAGLVSKVITMIGPPVSTITKLFSGLSFPILLVVGAITALGYAYVKNLGGFRTFVDNTVSKVIALFKSLYDTLIKFGKDVAEIVKSVIKVFKDLWAGDMIAGINDLSGKFGKFSGTTVIVFKAVVDVIKSLILIFKGDLKGALEQSKGWFENDAVKGPAIFVKVMIETGTLVKKIIDTVIVILRDLWSVVQVVVGWIKSNWPTIKDVFLEVFNACKNIYETVLKPVLEFILTQVNYVIHWVVDTLPLLWQAFKSVFEFIKTIVEAILGAVFVVIKAILNQITTFWHNHGENIKGMVSGVWEIIKSVISTAIKVVSNVIELVLNVITGNWSKAWQNVKNIASSLWEGITGVIKGAFKVIDNLFGNFISKAFTWGKDLIQGLIDGIRSMISSVTNAVTGVANRIKSLLHFSRPDEGPLRDYETWMPDFIGGLTKGINDNKDKLANAVKGMGTDIKTNINLSSSGAQGTGNTAGGIVLQIVNFYNNSSKDIEELAYELEAYRKKAAMALGG